MKVINSEPVDWKDLQNQVAKIFTDIDCLAKTEGTIELVRGEVNVDVFVEDTNSSPKLIYLCECKYWNSDIPKSVIHVFRSVVSDSGAHCGYIIARKRFQSGAYDSAIQSNIFLFSWNEFIETFEDRWIRSMINKLHNIGKPLRDYCNPMSDIFVNELNRLNKEEREKFDILYTHYSFICPYSSKDWYLNISTGNYVKSEAVKSILYVIEKILRTDKINSYDDFFKNMIEIGRNGIKEMDSLLGKEIRKPYFEGDFKEDSNFS